ncbi:MAG: ATP-dependent DNA helicase RecG [Fimbriimonadaceae bacterium]|nr:ATP-dependent DNA helicase RecG [Fimbriimonadaceae bacterium]
MGGPLETEVQFLKGVGPKAAAILHKLGLRTVSDVLWHLPRRYEDRRDTPQLMMLRPGQPATVRGVLESVETRPIRGGRVMIRATLGDDTGLVDLIWFNQAWIARELQKKKGEIVAYGMVRSGAKNKLEISSPEWEWIDADDETEEFAKVVPVYGLSEGVSQALVRRAAASAAEFFAPQVPESLPESILRSERLKSVAWALNQMHRPDSLEKQREARRRLVFEEFFLMQLVLQMKRNEVHQETGIAFPITQLSGQRAASTSLFEGASALDEGGTLWDELHAMLPFELTGAQRRVTKEIWEDMERPTPMNRLIQGDVGSGKTAVAAAAMLAAVRCGYQAALMAPTEILAEQHTMNLRRLFEPLGIAVVPLVGKQPAKVKRRYQQMAATGLAQICIGTHAIIQEGVEFQKLGLAVVDEQHRFGVRQRMALRTKAIGNPDVLVMTATPIPRTLTMTLYGDLDLSIIDELPPGRKPIKTHWKPTSERSFVYQAVEKLLEEGRQAYFVCPMIEDNEKVQAQAAEDLFYRLNEQVFPHRRVGLLHGQMKSTEKEATMDLFRKHELDILVSTVVIEVGVDVPNACVMVIEDANRFGLAQLHQLRGRVGRGEFQSFCILIADANSDESRSRMEILVQTTDGFKIAEEDLRLRGPGDMAGVKQHGALDFRIADLVQDSDLLEKARAAALELLSDDPLLAAPEHAGLRKRVKERRSESALVTVS